jgi:DNA-binding CsgD family transcriptional regulator
MTRRLKIQTPPLRDVPEPAELSDAVERHGRVGTWRRVAHSAEMEWSDDMYRLLGFEPGELPASIDSAAERMHRADAQRWRAELARAPDEAPTELVRYRVLLPDGSSRLLEARPAAGWRPDESGQPVLVGTLRDVTGEVTAARASAWSRAIEELFRDWDAPRDGAAGEQIAGVLARALGARAAALWIPRGEQMEVSTYWAEPDISRERLTHAFAAFAPRRGTGLVGVAWRDGEVAVLRPGMTLPRVSRLLPGGLRPIVAVPALRGEDVLAVLVVYGQSCLAGVELLHDELSATRATLGALLSRRLPAGSRSPLTSRETEVLQLAADGLGGGEIERRLRVSRSTVKSHFENIYGKLGVSNRPAAVARALRDGLIA